MFFCQEIHLQISLSDPIPFDPPHCLSPSPSPLFSLSPSLESHMVSLKWSTIKRGAQGAHCPHLFSCSAWAAPSLVETVSCDILCLPEVKLPGAFMQHVAKISGYVLYRPADYLALNVGYCIFWGVYGNLSICRISSDMWLRIRKRKLCKGVSIQIACRFSALKRLELHSLYARNQNMLYKDK